ncbi:conserved hypothetical protein [Coccidioides posadasii str. Silveira]|uniref:Uncharacterized protein n=2 Tax=Coccidioides posadasii TaxID=199306 RepID=E9D7B3_COCPS|nr:conserved hypothetical protein [Coccidioides posadasii str. Silveira]KMM71087.1 hypothetical protein CPAG_07394 [Coccidioides posadasii RMSCC 3488]
MGKAGEVRRTAVVQLNLGPATIILSACCILYCICCCCLLYALRMGQGGGRRYQTHPRYRIETCGIFWACGFMFGVSELGGLAGPAWYVNPQKPVAREVLVRYGVRYGVK